MTKNMPDHAQVLSQNQWNATLYDSKHSFVSKLVPDLIEWLFPRQGERILDLGCGTGHLTQKITEVGAEVVGIDNASSMIEQARKNYPNIRFEVADGHSFYFPEPFDAVFSNAAIHWMKTPEKVVACIVRALKPGGRFVAEFGGKGNIASILSALFSAFEAMGYTLKPESLPWHFPSIGEYAVLLEKEGLLVTYATLFDRPTSFEDGEKGFRHWMDMFGNGLLSEIPPDWRDEVVTHMENQLRPKLYKDGTWVADYRRLRIMAVKEA
jgi:SAM-dependent methyltransferase